MPYASQRPTVISFKPIGHPVCINGASRQPGGRPILTTNRSVIPLEISGAFQPFCFKLNQLIQPNQPDQLNQPMNSIN